MNKEIFQQDKQIRLQIVEGAESISEFAEHWDDLMTCLLVLRMRRHFYRASGLTHLFRRERYMAFRYLYLHGAESNLWLFFPWQFAEV